MPMRVDEVRLRDSGRLMEAGSAEEKAAPRKRGLLDRSGGAGSQSGVASASRGGVALTRLRLKGRRGTGRRIGGLSSAMLLPEDMTGRPRVACALARGGERTG